MGIMGIVGGGASVVLFMVLAMMTIGGESRESGYFLDAEEEEYMTTSCRDYAVSVERFGAVGDGVTSNTKAFKDAIDHLRQVNSSAGVLLYVPAGRWVTGSFNITSHFTLYLHRHAVLLGSQDMEEWPLIEPLPSYGRGRDSAGPRYSSLINGHNLTDVIITGNNGTIDGQGEKWWELFRSKKLQHTRGYLIEILYTDQILISDITLVNSPAWNIHPIYSTNVVVSGITITAPVDSPNTDGINPDSCSQVLIQDSYVVSGDDCIAIKSGWDEYGIAVGIPSKEIAIKRFVCISPDSAVIALGSEMSGGIKDVRAEDVTGINCESGIRIKTAVGRGNYVKDIFIRGMTLKKTIKWVFWMTSNYGDHPDDQYDPNAIPKVDNINYSNIVAENAVMAAKLDGIENAPFTGICISNATIDVVPSKKPIWNCTNVSGVASRVTPKPCSALSIFENAPPCSFPENRLAIEDVQFKRCTIKL